MLLLQIILFCLLYISMVKYAAGNSGLNCLYFYPEEYIEEAQKRGIADKEDTMKKGKQFMVPFCVIEGMEDVPYTKPWWYMIKRRILASIMYLAVAVIVAAIVVLIGKL